MHTEQRENEVLARITLITSVGDFISLFAVLVFIHKVSGSPLLAAYSIPTRSLAIAIGGVLLPYIVPRFSTKSLIFWTQFCSFFLMSGLAVLSLFNPNPYMILGVFFFQTLLKQWFEGSRESYSKSLGEHSQQRSLQAQILQSFYGAQIAGPVASFVLLKFLPVQIPLALDALSFLVAAILSRKLQDRKAETTQHSILRPLSYLGSHKGLRRIFLIRSVGYWVPVGIFNFLLFSVVQEHYKLDIVHSTWVYMAIGIGSILATFALKEQSFGLLGRIKQFSDTRLAAFALVLLAFSRVAFISLPTLWIALFFVVIGGFCNGLNAVTSQALRRKLTTQEQFPEVVGLELVVGKVTDWTTATLYFYGMNRGWFDLKSGMLMAAVLLLPVAFAHWSEELEV